MKWSDEFDKLLGPVIASGSGGVIVGICKGIINRYGGLKNWMTLLCVSGLVAVLTGLAVKDSGLSLLQQYAVVGVCTFLAEDILLGLGVLSSMFAKNPLKVFRELWDALRGK